jgi:hypothetical protein
MHFRHKDNSGRRESQVHLVSCNLFDMHLKSVPSSFNSREPTSRLTVPFPRSYQSTILPEGGRSYHGTSGQSKICTTRDEEKGEYINTCWLGF